MTAPPAIRCPLPPRRSPHLRAVQRHSAHWLHRGGVVLDRAAQRRFDQACFAGLTGRAFPDASFPDLCLVNGWTVLIFLVDDQADSSPRAEPQRLRHFRHAMTGYLRGDAAVPDPALGPLRFLLADVWAAPRARMPAHWRERFAGHVERYLDGVVTEAEHRAAGRRPRLPEYLRLRRATSAVFMFHDLLEFTSGRAVPEPAYRHPRVARTRVLGADLVGWLNDVFSLRKELAGPGGHNLVLALRDTYGLSLPAAVARATDMINKGMRRFVSARASVPAGFGPDAQPALAAYLDGLGHWIRATLDWSAESGRYRSDVTPDPDVPAFY